MRAVLLGCVVLASAACTHDSLLFPAARRVPLPNGVPDLMPTGTPTPAPAPFFGDGLDGSLDILSGNTNLQNVCLPVTLATGQTITLTDATPFDEGRLVVVHQAMDAFATMSDPGPYTNVGNAGIWELAEVATAAFGGGVGGGTTLALAAPLLAGYRSNGALGARAQVCTFPQFADVSISAPALLKAPDWNGTSGGLIAFAVSGTLTLDQLGGTTFDGAISANRNGPRGGAAAVGNCFTGDIDDETTNSNEGGAKGEGIDARLTGYGRGNAGSGGGGGNCARAGGGGGGGAGAGGLGGRESDMPAGNPDTGGRGGAATHVPGQARLLFGGGSGAGHGFQNTPRNGEDGAGAVLLFVNRLAGDSEIRAAGQSALDDANAEGGAGGSGGGTIILSVVDASGFTGRISTNGENGGDAPGPNGIFAGPGGGGGGGFVKILSGSFGPTVAFDVGGGPAGATSDGSAHGAEGGEDGILELAAE